MTVTEEKDEWFLELEEKWVVKVHVSQTTLPVSVLIKYLVKGLTIAYLVGPKMGRAELCVEYVQCFEEARKIYLVAPRGGRTRNLEIELVVQS